MKKQASKNHPTLARLLLSALVAFAPLAAHAVQDCELNGESINPDNGNTTRGKTGIMRCKDRDTGKPTREQELRDGKYHGLVRFYRDGVLLKEHSVNERGNMQGRAREFAPNGQAVFDAIYENGRYVGLTRAFHENGQPKRATFYENDRERASAEWNDKGQLQDLRCGERPMLAPALDDQRLCGFGAPSQVELVSGRGEVQSRSTWVQGKRTRYETYWRNGKPQMQVESSATERVERRFAEDGVKRREIRSAAGSAEGARSYKVQEQEFSERGTLVREQRWSPEDGRMLSDVSYYLNGQPREKTEYSRDGDRVMRAETGYYDSGKLASEGRYVEGGRLRGQQPVGSHKRYDEQGRLAAESIYDERGKLAREKVWNEAGVLVRDDEVFEDGSRKAFSR